MTVYHSGYQAVEKPEIRVNRNTKDFGTGFYCTVIKEQAQRWARRYNTKIVSIYDVRILPGLKILEFKEMTEEWLDFIVACRSGQSHDYDIVIGAMADDRIYTYVSDYIDGTITREQRLKVMTYGDQKHTDQRNNERGTDPHHTGRFKPVRRSV